MRRLADIFIIAGFLILLFTYGPVLKEELGYRFKSWGGVRYSLDANPEFPQNALRLISPVDTEFGIVIPKIGVNEEVFPNINAYDPNEYLPVLRKGVAHARGSQLPDQKGNVFLFGHSTDAFYNVSKYNAAFFLIGKLEEGDEVSLFYKDVRYKYEVVDQKVVMPEEVRTYVGSVTSGFSLIPTLTLQTCYPPGTTLKRLIVVAKRVES